MKSYVFYLCAALGLCLMVMDPVVGHAQAGAGGKVSVSPAINTAIVPQALEKTNSNSVEAGPKLSLDGKRLYYSRYRHPANTGGEKDEDIWYNEFIDSTQSWSEAINIGPPLNNKGPNFVFEVGWNGDSLFLGNVYGKGGKMSSGLSVSVRTGKAWSIPKEIKLKNDYNLNARGTYDLSHDRKALLISAEKTDSYGKRDLYVAMKAPGTNSYAKTEAMNLGPTINTLGDEASPFLSHDGRTLFFSSDGHNGYGMSDMFMSRRLDDTWVNWSNPENLGPQINTPFNDGQFVFTPRARYAYYSRGITPTRSDLYKIEMTYLFKADGAGAIGQTYVVRNVFDPNKSVINDVALPNLESVFNYLQSQKTMTVTINTHSNEHKSRDESFALSDARITAVEAYLVGKGIEKGRLKFQGYGQDVVANTSDTELKTLIAGQVEFSFVNFGR